jgi:AraC family ethanolamine operon transcriptional activator
MGYGAAIHFGQMTTLNMVIEAADYLDYQITDAESYATVLRGADVEISQLEPGPLRGHHLRVGIPGGDISWVETSLPLRGRGRFPAGVWTLSVVARTASRSQQHGVEVRTGSLFYHRPGAEHDGIYGRDFSVVCLCVRDEVLMETVRNEFPEVSDLLGQRWRVYEPAEDKRRELIAQFEQAATILRADENVRRSFAAKTVMQDELLAAFLEALAEATTPSPMPAVSPAAALVRRAEKLAGELVSKADSQPLCVSDLCVGCGVPRRTLNHAFQQVLGMGPITYSAWPRHQSIPLP